MTLYLKLFEIMTASIAQQKIRIRLKAFDRRMLDLSCDKIIQTADTTSASAIGPIPLPTKRKIYCVLRSPHVDKDSSCLLYTSPSPRDCRLSRMPSSA